MAADGLRWELFAGELTNEQISGITKDTHPSEVYTEESGFKLYLGAAHHALDLEMLDRNRISYVLNVAAHEIPTESLYGERFKCLRLNLEDDETFDISEHMDTALRFIDEARLNKACILVHCVAGVSRSATVVIAYLMSYRKWPLKRAATFVNQKRPWIYPNSGFVHYLAEFDKSQQQRCTIS